MEIESPYYLPNNKSANNQGNPRQYGNTNRLQPQHPQQPTNMSNSQNLSNNYSNISMNSNNSANFNQYQGNRLNNNNNLQQTPPPNHFQQNYNQGPQPKQ